MPQGRHQQTIDHYRAQLASHEKQAEQALEAAYKHVLATIQPMLDKLYDQMVRAMANGQQIPLHWLSEAQRLENVKKLIESQVDHFGGVTQAMVLQSQHQAALLGQEAAQAQLAATVPDGVSWTFGVPSPKAIASMVGATQSGGPLADLFNGFGAEAADAVGKALIRGITLGDNPRKVASSVQDALGVSRARALTISRTEMLRAYRGASIANYQANADVVESMVRVADLSARTCAACIALNGTVYALDADPGFHPNDRCVLIPKTKPWADILGPLGIDTSGIEESSPDIQSGSDWLDAQPESVQRQVLGAKYDGWANGDFSLDDIVGHSYDDDWGHSIYEKPLKDLVKA